MMVPPPSDTADRARANHDPPSVGGLPQPLTSFVGREREVAEIGALLDRPDVRLLTLTGPGGVGKTRLAIAMARRLAPDFADGVTFVSLSSVRDPELTPAAVAQAVGIPESSLLVGRLADRHLLLVLDNAEHLLDSVPALVADLLAGCPRLTVLATSRAALEISGEHRYLVSPLPLPGESGGSDQPVSDAVTLFEQRAQALRPEFHLTEGNADAVAGICRAVDGLPLAIELAASRVVFLTPAEIAMRLTDRLRLLTGGLRDAPERMRSLRATIDWSYDLLAPGERALFRQIAVFVGRFDLAAAATVTELDPFALLNGLASLVDKSLLQVVMPADGGEARYFLLETLRDYGLEQLAASGEEAAARERHATFYIDQAGAIAPWLEKGEPGVLDSVERLDDEYGNIRAALAWLDESGRGADLARAGMRLRTFWYLTERHAEALHWYERARPTDDATRIELLRMTGQMALLVGRGDAAKLLEASLTLAREAGDRQQEARALFHLSLLMEDSGNLEPAAEGFRCARDLFTQVGNEVAAMQCDYHLGVIAYGQGRLDDAERLLGDTIANAERAGDQTLPAWCATYLALVACQRGDLAAALAALTGSPSPVGVPALRHHVPDFLATAAVIAAGHGRHALAARLLGTSRRSGYQFKLPERLAYDRVEADARRSLGDADFEREQARGRRMPAGDIEAELDRLTPGGESDTSPGVIAPQGDFDLTEREREVLRKLADGLTNQEIADNLFVSRRTIATHVDHILGKLDVRSRTAAVAWAVRNGLA
jgi:non-specific serine/threonine protein kinase